MESFGELVLLFIRQFAGGPGPIENNLMRFGLAAVFWLALLLIAWSRQKNQDLPREKWLLWGFGFALLRELIMLGLTIGKITGFLEAGNETIYYYPLEHGLAIIAVVVVAGAFLRFVLKDERISQRYLQISISLIVLTLLISFVTWPQLAYSSPGIHFNETWEARAFHVLSIFLIAAAIIILLRKRDWLSLTVSIALGFFFISEFLFLVSFASDSTNNKVICPISNAFHILAIPIIGFVYLKEMSDEKKRTEDKLDKYRDHLEDLVDEKTSMLVAQNEIADSLSQSLDLETILNMALDKVLSVLSMEAGLLFLLDREGSGISLGAYRGRLSQEDLDVCIQEGCPYEKLSKDAIDEQAAIQVQTDETLSGYAHIRRERIQLLVSVPLISKNHIVGALTLGSRKAEPLEQANIELLTAICHQIGMAVENANLYQETEIWARELSTLHQASINLGLTLDSEQINKEIAIQSTRLTGRQMACVIYCDEESEIPEVISCVGMAPEIEDLLCENLEDSNLFDQLRKTRTSIVINDIQRDARFSESWKREFGIHSLLCIPIWGTDEPVEFLFIMDERESKSWRSRDIELVESFISRAAVALENANLYKQMEWAAALEERQRIAADMHDGLAQIIGLLGLKLDHTTDKLLSVSQEELLEALKDIREIVRQASVEARKSISSLQSAPLPRKTLQETLTDCSDQWLAGWSDGNDFTFKTAFSFSEPLVLPPDQISQVVPIIQEAIINAQKHSGASQIQIQGQQSDGQVIITIQDDGKGFDIDALAGKEDGHFGLKTMRARATRFGGDLQISSRPGIGTIVTLSWDLDGDRKEKKDGLSRQSVHPKLHTREKGNYA